jgi:hypothetical protein
MTALAGGERLSILLPLVAYTPIAYRARGSHMRDAPQVPARPAILNLTNNTRKFPNLDHFGGYFTLSIV